MHSSTGPSIRFLLMDGSCTILGRSLGALGLAMAKKPRGGSQK